MNLCYGYNCTKEPVTKLKAWGPGEVREFCGDCARVRHKLRGYTEVEDG